MNVKYSHLGAPIIVLALLAACAVTLSPASLPTATMTSPTATDTPSPSVTPTSFPTRTPTPSPTATLTKEEAYYFREISEIDFDTQGNVWIAGFGGAVKLDPVNDSFSAYSIEGVFDDVQVTSAIVTTDDKLWIGTLGSEILYLDNGTWIKSWEKSWIYRITSFALNSNGLLCASADYGGVLCYDGKAWVSLSPNNGSNQSYPLIGTDDLAFTPDNTLWALANCCMSNTTIYWFDGQIWNSKEFSEYKYSPYTYRLVELISVSDGTLWFRGSTIFHVVIKDVWQEYSFSEFLNDEIRITAFATVSSNKVWIGTSDGQVAYLDMGQWHILEIKLGEAITEMSIAPDDSVWGGTKYGRLVHIRDEERQCYQVNNLQIAPQSSCEQ